MLLGRKRCCCGACTYFHAVASSPAEGQVTFQGAIDNSLITVLSGTWATDGSGRLKVTGSGAIRLDVSQPDSAAAQRLEFFGNKSLTTNDDDTVVRLSVDYTDDNNRHYGEGKAFVPGFGSPATNIVGKIARVSGGSETVLHDQTASGFSIDFREVTAFLTEYLAGAICIQDGTVAVGAGFGASPIIARYPAIQSAGPVGGYKAAIEIEQDGGNVFTFDQVILKRTGSACPQQECLACFALGGCAIAPAQVVVTIAGIVNGTGGGGEPGAADFNGSFTLDLVRTARKDPGVFGGCVEAVGYASPVFALAGTITSGGVDYTHGRVYLIPVTPVSGCETLFKLYLQWQSNPAQYCTGAKLVGVMEPTSGTNVGFDCTGLDEAEYSGGGASTPLDTTGATFTVSAV